MPARRDASEHGFESMLNSAVEMGFITPGDAEQFRERQEAQTAAIGETARLVQAVFDTPAGESLLRAMYRRFVHASIVEPGDPPESHGIRQGQANVVYWLTEMLNREGD